MEKFSLATTIASIIILTGFLALSIRKFGLQPSYSAYAPHWKKAVPIHNVNLWSLITIVVALLFTPGMIQAGAGSPWQFLGFLSPAYLVLVALTPLKDDEDEKDDSDQVQKENKRRRITHVVGAILCAIATVAWLILVAHKPWLVPVALYIPFCAGFASRSCKSSATLWSEMALFVGGYIAILMSM